MRSQTRSTQRFPSYLTGSSSLCWKEPLTHAKYRLTFPQSEALAAAPDLNSYGRPFKEVDNNQSCMVNKRLIINPQRVRAVKELPSG